MQGKNLKKELELEKSRCRHYRNKSNRLLKTLRSIGELVDEALKLRDEE